MKLYKKIIILLIVLIFSYILFSLLQNRTKIYAEIESRRDKETFGTSEKSEIVQAENKTITGIQNINSNYSNMPLHQYCMKASYNSAITGNYVSIDMLKYVLSRGCRFLDFEVFYIEDKPCVSYTTDTTFKTIETQNVIPLDNILTSVVSNAFSSLCSNPKDPVFIHLRIKSKDTNIYKEVAKVVEYTLKDKLYRKRIDEKTALNDILGKVVLVIDKTINYYYQDDSYCNVSKNCVDLTTFVNLESGGDYLRVDRYTDVLNKYPVMPKVNGDNVTADIEKYQLILPDYNSKNVKNPSHGDFVLKYGCQIMPYRFYINDQNLEEYEEFFKDNKFAFVPLAHGIMHYEKIDEYENS